MKTTAVLILAMIADTMGNVFVSKAMKTITMASAAAGEDLIATAMRAGATPMLWLGTALLIVFFLLYTAALSWADLSFVLPATAFAYVLNVAAAHYFLNETVTPARWAGSIVITLGVLFVSRSEVRTQDGRGETEL